MKVCSRTDLGFDGSSIRGWQAINESDMLADPGPFHDSPGWILSSLMPTVSIIADIVDPITKQGYHKDPRGVCQRAALSIWHRARAWPTSCLYRSGTGILHL